MTDTRPPAPEHPGRRPPSAAHRLGAAAGVVPGGHRPSHRLDRRIDGPAGATVGVGLVVVVHLLLARPMRVPIIHPDELGYLLNARYLAGGGLRSQVQYYPGFSLLLIPAWLVSSSPLTVFRAALQIQAALAGVGAVLVWRMIPRLTGPVAGWRRAVVTGLVCAYPATLLYGDFALSELAFAVVFVLVVLAAAWALPGEQLRAWTCFGLASGILVLVHPRGLAVVVASVVMGAVVLGWRRSSIGPLLAMAAGLVTSLSVTLWLVRLVKTPATQLGAYQPDGVLSKSLSFHGLTSLFVEVFGQFFYLSVATVGLVPLGLLLGGRSLWRVARGGDRRPVVLAQAFAALSFLGVLGLSSLFANLGDRADKLVYGRYNEGVIAPLLVVALVDLLVSRRGRAGRRWLATGVAGTVVSGLVVLAGDSHRALGGPINPANVLALQPLITRMGDHLHVVALAAVGLAAVASLSLVSWRLPVVALAGLALVFAASAVDTETGYIVPGSRARAQQDVIARALDDIRASGIGDLSCIAYDPAPLGYSDYTYYQDQFLSPAQQFAAFDDHTGLPPCGTLAVSRDTPDDFAAHHPGARIITSENFVDQSLWAVPRPGDATFDALAGGGWLSPGPSASTALPAADLADGQLSVEDGTDLTLARGRSRDVTVTAAHGQGGAPWPAVSALHSGSGAFGVRLTVQWYTTAAPGNGAAPALGADATAGTSAGGQPTACLSGAGDPVAFACSRVELPATLLPGQTVQLPVELTAGGALPAGVYRVQVGLVQEGVSSFTTHVDLRVTVS